MRPVICKVAAAVVAVLASLAIFSATAFADGRLVVNTTADTATGCIGVGAECSLRAAIERVNAGELSGEVEIEVEAQGTIDIGAAGELKLEPPAGVSALKIVGPGATKLTIDGQQETRAFRVENGTVTISGLTVENAREEGFTLGTEGGAALYQAAGTVTLDAVTLRSNSLGDGRNGGAIDFRGGELTVEHSLLEDNKTGSSLSFDGGGGGAIYEDVNSISLLTVSDSVLKGNTARFGGGIDQDEGSLLLRNTRIEGSEAEFTAGGLYADAGSALATTLIERSDIVDNKTAGDGAGVVSADEESELMMIESTVAGNEAESYGGGIYVEGPTTISQSTISRNLATAGAGIQVQYNSLRLLDSTVADNGGIGIGVVGHTYIVGSTVADNGKLGILVEGAVPTPPEVTSSVLAGNGDQLGSPSDCEGYLDSGGANVVEHPGNCEFAAPGDQTSVDPELGALADNGGPTETVAPTSRTSPAINHGAQPAVTDQRGLTRPVPAGAGNTDAGAVEVQLPVAEPSDPPAISPSSGLTAGTTLTCAAGGWDTDTILDPSFGYVWLLEGEPIATGPTYELASGDADEELACEVTADDGAGSATALSAAVELLPAEASLAPSSLAFGSRNIESGPSEAQTLTLSNEGGTDLAVTSVGSDDPQFPVDASACPASLAPGADCLISVSFSPSATGARLATVTAQTSSGEPTVAVSGTGTAPVFDVSPISHDFGAQLTDSLSAGELFTVTNEGDGPMTLGQVTIGGAGVSQFEIPGGDDGCSMARLLPGEECRVEVFFDPDQVGAATATLEFPGDAPGSVALSGTGVAPAFSASPTAWDFGEQDADAGPSAPRQIVVTNVGTAPMQIGQVALQGADPSAFVILPGEDCSQASLAPDAGCTVEVAFDPEAGGLAEATLSFPGDAPGTVQLTGTGTAAELVAAPGALDFGTVRVGDGPTAARAATVTNEGQAPATVGPVLLSGPGKDEFGLAAAGCEGATLAPAQSCQVSVSFLAGAAGAYSAELTVDPVGAGEAAAVSLTGTADASPAPAPQPPTPEAPRGRAVVEAPSKVRVDPDGGLPLHLSCGPAGATPCAARVTVAAAGGGPLDGPVATWSGAIDAGAGAEASPTLSRAARVALGKSGKLSLLITVTSAGGESSAHLVALAPSAPTLRVDSIHVAGSSLRLTLICAKAPSGCRGDVRVTAPATGVVVARGKVAFGPGPGTARLALTAPGRRLLQAEPAARLTVSVTALDGVFGRRTVHASQLSVSPWRKAEPQVKRHTQAVGL